MQHANQQSELQYNIGLLKQKHILIVDDELINRKLITRMFSICKDCKITCASNGKEALQLLHQQQDNKNQPEIDIIVMDCNMPIMDGLQATKAIRLFSQVPIIGLSGNCLDSDIQASLDSGMNDFCSKPVNRNKLIQTIAKHLQLQNNNHKNAIKNQHKNNDNNNNNKDRIDVKIDINAQDPIDILQFKATKNQTTNNKYTMNGTHTTDNKAEYKDNTTDHKSDKNVSLHNLQQQNYHNLHMMNLSSAQSFVPNSPITNENTSLLSTNHSSDAIDI
jgi:CheY-like chemotaxis protein